MAAMAAPGTLISDSMDLTSEYATNIGAFESKLTAYKGRDSTLYEPHSERLLLIQQLAFVTHFIQVMSSNKKLWGKEGEKRVFQIKPE